jgi:hypothetical protein
VLVHGTGGFSTRWKPILPTLEKYFTVYAVDRRGRGESGDGSNYAIEREFDDVAAVVDPIGNGVDLTSAMKLSGCPLMNLNFFNYHLHSRRASLRLTRFRVIACTRGISIQAGTI